MAQGTIFRLHRLRRDRNLRSTRMNVRPLLLALLFAAGFVQAAEVSVMKK